MCESLLWVRASPPPNTLSYPLILFVPVEAGDTCVSLGHFADVCTLLCGHTCRPLGFAVCSPETRVCMSVNLLAQVGVCAQCVAGCPGMQVCEPACIYTQTLLPIFHCCHFPAERSPALIVSPTKQVPAVSNPAQDGEKPRWNREHQTETAHHPASLPRSLQPRLPRPRPLPGPAPHSPQTPFG